MLSWIIAEMVPPEICEGEGLRKHSKPVLGLLDDNSMEMVVYYATYDVWATGDGKIVNVTYWAEVKGPEIKE